MEVHICTIASNCRNQGYQVLHLTSFVRRRVVQPHIKRLASEFLSASAPVCMRTVEDCMLAAFAMLEMSHVCFGLHFEQPLQCLSVLVKVHACSIDVA
eukprot:1160691-Pelagomonas_calceolata.AAC.8